MVAFVGIAEDDEKQRRSGDKERSAKNKAAPFTEQVANGDDAIIPVRLVLVDLRERIQGTYEQAGYQAGHKRYLAGGGCGPCVNNKKYPGTLKNEHCYKPDKWMPL